MGRTRAHAQHPARHTSGPGHVPERRVARANDDVVDAAGDGRAEGGDGGDVVHVAAEVVALGDVGGEDLATLLTELPNDLACN